MWQLGYLSQQLYSENMPWYGASRQLGTDCLCRQVVVLTLLTSSSCCNQRSALTAAIMSQRHLELPCTHTNKQTNRQTDKTVFDLLRETVYLQCLCAMSLNVLLVYCTFDSPYLSLQLKPKLYTVQLGFEPLQCMRQPCHTLWNITLSWTLFSVVDTLTVFSCHLYVVPPLRPLF